MAVRATHVPTGTEIDLEDQDNLITQGLLEDLHHHCSRGVLECREHDQDGIVHGIWVYLKKFRGQWLLCHHDCDQVHRASSGKSVEHQWQQDYWQRAGDAAGYETEQEMVFRGVRVDVAIRGPAATIGVEVQRSNLAVANAVSRTQKARKCGVTSLWSADRRNPPWAYRVPHVETNLFPGRDAPRGSWTVVSGPRKVLEAKCTPINFGRCPDTGRGRYCGKFHPKLEPLTGLCIDDVAERAPAGDLVPLEIERRPRRVYLVSADHKSLYDELVAGRVLRDDRGGSGTRINPFGPCRRQVHPANLAAGREAVQARPQNDDLPDEVWQMLARGYDR